MLIWVMMPSVEPGCASKFILLAFVRACLEFKHNDKTDFIRLGIRLPVAFHPSSRV